MMQVLVPATNDDSSCHLLQLENIGDEGERMASWINLSPSVYMSACLYPLRGIVVVNFLNM